MTAFQIFLPNTFQIQHTVLRVRNINSIQLSLEFDISGGRGSTEKGNLFKILAKREGA